MTISIGSSTHRRRAKSRSSSRATPSAVAAGSCRARRERSSTIWSPLKKRRDSPPKRSLTSSLFVPIVTSCRFATSASFPPPRRLARFLTSWIGTSASPPGGKGRSPAPRFPRVIAEVAPERPAGTRSAPLHRCRLLRWAWGPPAFAKPASTGEGKVARICGSGRSGKGPSVSSKSRCHPGESRAPYSRGRSVWTPAFAWVTRERAKLPEIRFTSCPPTRQRKLRGEHFSAGYGVHRSFSRSTGACRPMFARRCVGVFSIVRP